MVTKFRYPELTVLLLMLLIGPAHAIPEPFVPEEPDVPVETGGKATYSWLRQNVFATCNYCHIAVPGVSFMRHEDVLRHVVPGHPEASRLYFMVVTRRMPRPRGGLPPDQLKAIHDWIKNGAKDD
jgi:hypothetical protein